MASTGKGMHMLDLHNLSEGASVKAVVVVAEDAHANHAVTKQLIVCR